MKDKNTLEKTTFVILNISALFLSALLFCVGFTQRDLRIDGDIRFWIVLMSVVIVSWWSTKICIRYRQNFVSIGTNVLLMCMVLLVMFYGVQFKAEIIVSSIIGVCISLLYARAVWNQYHARKRRKRNARRYTIHAVKIIITICVLTSITVAVGNNNLWSSYEEPDTPAKTCLVTWSEEKTMKENMDVIQQFGDEDLWKDLPEDDKLSACQTVCMVESNYLGIPESKVVCDSTMRVKEWGNVDEKSIIHINKEHLCNDKPADVLNTIAHETRHIYQRYMCKMYDEIEIDQYESLLVFREITFWKNDFSDYKSGHENYDDYYTQECEVDARQYAEQAVRDYYQKIENYNAKTSND